MTSDEHPKAEDFEEEDSEEEPEGRRRDGHEEHRARLIAHAASIDPARAELVAARLGPHPHAVLLATAYPALLFHLESAPDTLPLEPSAALGGQPVAPPLDVLSLRSELEALDQGERFRAELRLVTHRHRLGIAMRELLPQSLGGADVDETAQELSTLADLTIEAALRQAVRVTGERLGHPVAADGTPSALIVLGMGKLGGEELNAGSDVDLVCFYDTDAAEATEGGRVTTAHAFWTKVVQRMTENLAAVTAEGFVWRVDHRLRPEGARGPLVNSLAAAERYYESFGRLWERSALLRARPVAGDRQLGEQVLAMLSPFVWTRRVDPGIASAMYDLVHRARAELSRAPERDLKLGPGGIREAEFFVQALQLIWGGREARIRDRSTLVAVSKLLAAGLVTEREAEELTAAYLTLRRVEHAVQWSTGLQTHSLPTDPEDARRLARALGYRGAEELAAALELHTSRVGALLASLLPTRAPPQRWQDALLALDRGELEAFAAQLAEAGMQPLDGGEQLARDLFETARLHPDGLLGARTRERHRPFVDALLDALSDSADPAQAARFLRGFSARVRPLSVYTKLLVGDPAALRRIVTAFGGSAFVGEAVSAHPELADLVLFERAVPTTEDARQEVLETGSGAGEVDLEREVGRIRRAKQRITTQVALADLAGEMDTREATLVLSALADASLEAATRFSLGQPAHQGAVGLSVIAMGKLGGQEIGYGSDLDVIFVYDGEGHDDPPRYFSRRARRIIQMIGMPHWEGRGYELDTRLRPSGSQGLLVVSVEAFARYHQSAKDGGRHRRAATWERLALLRARFAAGDAALGARVIEIARAAAYERGGEIAALAADIHRLRERMERELAHERKGRYDLKLGRGGLVDIEFATQLLQLAHGHHPEVRTTETRLAIEALATVGALDAEDAESLAEGYAFLRQLEQRIRVLHADSSHLIEEDAAGLVPLARRMGLHDLPAQQAANALIERYRAVTTRVRETYERLVVAAASAPR